METATLVIETTDDLKRLAGNEPFGVTYRKANGRFRKATAQFGVTHDSRGNQLVKGTLDETQAEIENEQGVVRYFDIEKDAYRQFSVERLIVVEIGGQKYNFGLKH